MIGVLLAAGCAMTLGELRPARPLRGGEVQAVYGQDLVLPTATVRQSIELGQQLAEVARDDAAGLSAEQKQDLTRGVAALALGSPGMGSWVEAGVGLGYGWDVGARVGSGSAGLVVRKGLWRHPWSASVSARAGVNGGDLRLSALSTFNGLVEVGELRRADLGASAQLGLDLGEVGMLWGGAKGTVSPYTLTLDPSRVDLDPVQTQGRLSWVGPYAGAALGWRYVWLAAELSVLRAGGGFELYGEAVPMQGWVVLPSWGVVVGF